MQLAWQILHPDARTVRIPYRISFSFNKDQPDRTNVIIGSTLEKLFETMRVTLSRKIILTNEGRTTPLPTLLVTFSDQKGTRGWVEKNGKSIWRMEGVLEADRREVKSISTCSVSVRYVSACILERAPTHLAER
jgi:hypothetical protein